MAGLEGEVMNELDLLTALKAVELAHASLDLKNAPRYSKETIEQARQETRAGLALAIKALENQLEKVGA